jgi:hypothetical protein
MNFEQRSGCAGASRHHRSQRGGDRQRKVQGELGLDEVGAGHAAATFF